MGEYLFPSSAVALVMAGTPFLAFISAMMLIYLNTHRLQVFEWRDSELGYYLVISAMSALFAASIIVAFPQDFEPWVIWLARLMVTGALVTMAVVDGKSGQVPLSLTWPFMLAGAFAAAARAITLDLRVLPYWLAILLVFRWNILGGGDAKLLLGVFGLYPTPEMLLAHTMVVLVRAIGTTIYRYRRQALSHFWKANLAFLKVGVTDEELQKRGVRATWGYALATALVLWLGTSF